MAFERPILSLFFSLTPPPLYCSLIPIFIFSFSLIIPSIPVLNPTYFVIFLFLLYVYLKGVISPNLLLDFVTIPSLEELPCSQGETLEKQIVFSQLIPKSSQIREGAATSPTLQVLSFYCIYCP